MDRVRTLSGRVSDALSGDRFALVAVVIFAASGLLLATVGLYGVVSYAVSRRTRELGIRIALGAQAATISRLILRQGFVLGFYGVIIGLLGSVILTRLLDSVLFEVRTIDPAIYGTLSATLLTVAWIAGYVPARRAVRVDPVAALRTE